MSERITAISAYRWCRDHMARVLASFTTFTFMWIAVGCAIAVLFYWDGIWARNQAPAGMELSFQAGGWVIRIWTVFALVGVVALFRAKARILGGVFFLSWLATSILSYGHVLGFIATGQAERYAAGSAVENVFTISEDGLEEKLTLIAQQKDEIRTDRDADVAALEGALDDLINDGNAGNDEAATNTYTALIADVRTKARDDLAALSEQERNLTLANTETKLQANQEQVTATKVDPFYLVLADWFAGGTREESVLKSIAQRWGAFWGLIIELIGGGGPAALYAAHAHFSDRRLKEQEELPPEAPKNDNKPDLNANDKMTQQEKIRKMNEARNAYRNAGNATAIRVGPTLTTDKTGADAA